MSNDYNDKNKQEGVKVTRNLRAEIVQKCPEPVALPQTGILYVFDVSSWKEKQAFYNYIAYSFGVPSTQKKVYCVYFQTQVMHYERTCQGVYYCPEGLENPQDTKSDCECTVVPCRFRYQRCSHHACQLKKSEKCKFKLHFYVPIDERDTRRALLCLGHHNHPPMQTPHLSQFKTGKKRRGRRFIDLNRSEYSFSNASPSSSPSSPKHESISSSSSSSSSSSFSSSDISLTNSNEMISKHSEVNNTNREKYNINHDNNYAHKYNNNYNNLNRYPNTLEHRNHNHISSTSNLSEICVDNSDMLIKRERINDADPVQSLRDNMSMPPSKRQRQQYNDHQQPFPNNPNAIVGYSFPQFQNPLPPSLSNQRHEETTSSVSSCRQPLQACSERMPPSNAALTYSTSRNSPSHLITETKPQDNPSHSVPILPSFASLFANIS